MKGSLQDQLLGAGLIKKQKANTIKTAKKKAAKRGNDTKNEASELAEKARLEEQRKSQALNEKNKKEAEQKAIQAQIRQMIESNSIKKTDDKAEQDSELTYNFTDDKKIKTLLVSVENHALISRGIIAIAKLVNDNSAEYFLIPAEAARKINERDDSSIVLLNDYAQKSKAESQDEQQSEDDPYADFQVPDDLMW